MRKARRPWTVRARTLPAASGLVVAWLQAAPAAAQSLHDDDEAAHERLAPVSRQDVQNPLRGSTFLFEQSLSTQAAHLESPEQSYVPFYGWWLSLRPRWNFNDHWRLQLRLDYYKEFTNDQDTTLYREDVFGDIWTEGIFSTKAARTGPWKNTSFGLGGRVILPTSKVSQAEGLYFNLGALARISQTVPLLPESANALSAARFSFILSYLHPFTNSSTPTHYDSFDYSREDDSGRPFLSHQISGETLVEHQLSTVFEGTLEITPRLGFTVDMIWVNRWHYAPTAAVITTPTGPAVVTRADDHQFTQLVWQIAAFEYSALPELTLGAGYYNVTNALSPDGTLRSPFGGGQDNLFWSPDARLFLDVTANLDRILEDLSGRRREPMNPGELADAARSARRRSATQLR